MNLKNLVEKTRDHAIEICKGMYENERSGSVIDKINAVKKEIESNLIVGGVGVIGSAALTDIAINGNPTAELTGGVAAGTFAAIVVGAFAAKHLVNEFSADIAMSRDDKVPKFGATRVISDPSRKERAKQDFINRHSDNSYKPS